MSNIGWWEIVVVLVLVLLIFGPKKLPELGSSLGRTIRGFRKGLKEGKDEVASTVAEVRDAAGVDQIKSTVAEVRDAAGINEIKSAVAEVREAASLKNVKDAVSLKTEAPKAASTPEDTGKTD